MQLDKHQLMSAQEQKNDRVEDGGGDLLTEDSIRSHRSLSSDHMVKIGLGIATAKFEAPLLFDLKTGKPLLNEKGKQVLSLTEIKVGTKLGASKEKRFAENKAGIKLTWTKPKAKTESILACADGAKGPFPCKAKSKSFSAKCVTSLGKRCEVSGYAV